MKGPSATFNGDFSGGLTGIILALPSALALGTIVFAPLGPDYVAFGVAAGLVSLFAANVFTAPTAGIPIVINGPFSLSSLMLASALTAILTMTGADSNPALVPLAVSLLFFVAFLSG